MKALLAVPLLAVMIAGCSSVTPVSAPDRPAEPVTPTVECLPVADSLLAAINEGVIGVDPNNSLVRGAATVATERESVWFVAAEITGPGLNPGDAIGVWATNRGNDDRTPGLIFSVGGFAHQFSDWGHGEDTEAALSQFEPGAQEAIDCLG